MKQIWEIDFRTDRGKEGQVPIWNEKQGYGVIQTTSAMPARILDLSDLEWRADGLYKTQSSEQMYYLNENHYDYGGLAFRVPIQGPGAYRVEVKVAVGSEAVNVSLNGMNAKRLVDHVPWDSAGTLEKFHVASWEQRTWRYDYVASGYFIDIEVEPEVTRVELDQGMTKTVGIEAVKVTPIENEALEENRVPHIFILGDSTVKSYIYEEAIMSGWGQIFQTFFNEQKVAVRNYSMGGRSVFNMYHEGRFNEILLRARPGDYILLQSGHNDESMGEEKGPKARFGRGNTADTYVKWLETIYLPALEARGILPIFVTPMTRINMSQKHEVIFEGFGHSREPGIDFPGLMKEVARRHDVVVLDLYEESKKYLEEIGVEAAQAMFLSVEAGETPGKTNSGSYANGNPSGAADGTHFKETLSKQWARIVASEVIKHQLPIAHALYDDVREAISKKEWFRLFPEMCQDVQVGENAYYREQIECLVRHGVLGKDEEGNFHPKEPISGITFAKALEKAWDLESGRVPHPVMGSEEKLTREEMAVIIYQLYKQKFGRDEEGHLRKPRYMTDYNGVTMTPDNPNYDPNLVGEEAQYYPLVGWGALEDTEAIDTRYSKQVKAAYELGLIRSEVGIRRGKMINGSLLEPKCVVTREKAAKALYFLRILAKEIRMESHRNK